MIILGLAGHVDHGKTALVRALTGTDTDRLPEEKARGMTTDLGFAAMELKHEGRRLEIGVVDVPGHERYIRNMVAGAWALDLALLVVAADDGWMYQTENHARVLAALGRPRILVAVTKADKVSPLALAQVEEDCRARVIRIFDQGTIAGSWTTSTLSGSGVDELKRAIGEEGARIESTRPAQGGNQPYLYVDRIFTQPGAGLVVCGTLLGGSVRVDEELQLHPSEEIVRIKSIESLGRKLESAEGPMRVAFNISKPRVPPSRGDLVTCSGEKRAPFFSGTEFLIKISPLPFSTPDIPGHAKSTTGLDLLRKGGEVEVAAGSADAIASIAPLGKGSWYRAVSRKPLAIGKELPLAIIRHGGADILGKASIMRAGKTDKALRKNLALSLEGLGELPLPAARLVMRLRLEGVEAEESKAVQKDSGDTALSPELAKAALGLKIAGSAGVDLSQSLTPGAQAAVLPRKVLQALCAAGIATPIDRDIFVHRDVYDELVRSTLRGKVPGDRLEIGEAKEKTGYSRKYVIPFLNRMERDGYVKRDGDFRIVLSSANPAVLR